MMRRALASTAIAAVVFTTPLFADDSSIRTITHDLGAVIGSEAFCGMTLDQAGISTYIEQNIPADQIDFPTNLNMAVLGAQMYFDGMSASTKLAYCTGITRSAKAFGLAK